MPRYRSSASKKRRREAIRNAAAAASTSTSASASPSPSTGGSNNWQQDGGQGQEGKRDESASPLQEPNHHQSSSLPDILLTLEEEVRFQEGALQALIDRRSQIVQQLERARTRRQSLHEKKEELLKRRTQLSINRMKHLTLQKEIHESLSKSRERLGRLASLEEQEEATTGEGTTTESSHEQYDQREELSSEADNKGSNNSTITDTPALSEDNQKHHSSGADVEMKDAPMENQTGKRNESPQKLRPTRRPSSGLMATLVEFNRNHVWSPTSLGTFLPLIGPDLMKTILTLAGREANACGGARRHLLWNTCLDFALLSRGAVPNRKRPLEETTSASEETHETATIIDPNVSLCPYELSGVCADEFCPYQHTTRETLLPRESLPLPPLDLGEHGNDTTEEKRPKLTKPAKKSPVTTETQSAESQQVDETESTTETSAASFTEEDFIALPTPSSADDVVADGEESDENDDFVSAYYKSVRWSFWWGGTLEGDELSIEDTLNRWADLRLNEAPPDYTFWFGRVIDVCRISIHMGRKYVACHLATMALERIRRDKQDENLLTIASQVENVLKSVLLQDTSTHSFYRTSFVVQMSLAILSETARAMSETTSEDDVASIIESATHCIDAIVTKETNVYNSSPPDVREVVRLIISNYSGDKKSTDAPSCVRRFEDLENGVRWTQAAFQPKSPLLASLDNIEDQVLKPCWSFCSDWIRSDARENEVDRVFKGLLATAVIGFAALGSLERFSVHIPRGEDKIDTSMTAALVEVDATINRLLNRLLDELSFLPVFNLLIAPLSAVSVTTASFLRMYSNAQHRVEGVLQLNQKKSSRGPTSALFGSCSELLWSQLFQLRMTLPLEGNVTSSTEYDWELPQTAKDSSDSLLERMRTSGVRVNHVALPGDSLLSQAMCNDNPNQPKKMKQKLGKAFQAIASTLLKLIFQGDTEEVNTSIVLKNATMNVREDAHSRIPSRSISTLPLSLLVAGQHVLTLNLENCTLCKLPVSFGLYFPNLERLDLSKNSLKELPSSFKALDKLQELRFDLNRIEDLGDVAGRALRRLFATHNRLSSVSLPTWKWTKLEELDLSHNHLEITEAERAIWTVRFKKLRRLDYHPQTALES